MALQICATICASNESISPTNNRTFVASTYYFDSMSLDSLTTKATQTILHPKSCNSFQSNYWS
jgi:hypothetical protein